MSRATSIPKQEPLPPLRWLLQPDATRFAHPAEIELARLLTFYGQRWAYEPTMFAVRWGIDGRPEAFVTPDFYLPDRDQYLELTTMRQRLVTRKNRKFRLLRKHYPHVRVRLLYLRDFERLQLVYGANDAEQEVRLGAILYPKEDVERRITELASQIAAGLPARTVRDRGQRPLLLGVGPGSDRFLLSLGEKVRALGVGVDLDRVDLTTMPAPPALAPVQVRLARVPTASLPGRAVVLVQEVLSSGLSAAFLETWLQRRGAEEVAVCALLDREAARVVDVPVICRGFLAPDVGLAGYGLTRRREFRDLPFIAEVETG
ncbi:MAG: hypothetical protein H0V00_07555 [Chloroflexia bacterium]|nr:hypothetical protein [Chloroflexia bacterium]